MRRRLILVWRLNRTLEVSLVVAGGAVLALALALGGLGSASASQSGIALDAAAHATATPAGDGDTLSLVPSIAGGKWGRRFRLPTPGARGEAR